MPPAMDRVKAALERLDEMLDDLEAAVAEREARDAAAVAERRQLVLELDQSRTAERRTRETTTAVSQRLDGAIDRLQTVLEE
jgi:septal ring factor EnvC (AmiA/AmiB activator)